MPKIKKTTLWALLPLLFLPYFRGFENPATKTPRAAPSLFASEIAVTLNPNGIAPLSAVADFQTRVGCTVQILVLGEIEVAKTFNAFNSSHAVPILGLYPDRANSVVLTVAPRRGAPESKTVTIRTAPLPDFLPTIEILTADFGRMEPGMNLSSLSVTAGGRQETYPIIFDGLGEIRWYMDLSKLRGTCFPFERIRNGNFIFGLRNSLYEYDMLGKLQRQITKPGYGFHHDVKELPNGNLVAAVDKIGATIVSTTGVVNTVEDHMIELDRATGAIVTEWDFRKLLDVTRNEDLHVAGDWLHQNALWYSERDDCFIISGRFQGVFKVTRDNRLKWILSPHQGWGNSGADGSGFDTNPFLLTAIDADGQPYDDQIQDGILAGDDFDWTWGQHSPKLLPNGNIFIFDNGFNRCFSELGPFYSRGVEYRLDETNMTVRQVWQYGQERGPELYSTIISDVDDLPITHNRLIMPGVVRLPDGSYAKIVEVSYPQGAVVFEPTIHFKNLRATGDGTGQFDIVYRSHRLDLYADTPPIIIPPQRYPF